MEEEKSIEIEELRSRLMEATASAADLLVKAMGEERYKSANASLAQALADLVSAWNLGDS